MRRPLGLFSDQFRSLSIHFASIFGQLQLVLRFISDFFRSILVPQGNQNRSRPQFINKIAYHNTFIQSFFSVLEAFLSPQFNIKRCQIIKSSVINVKFLVALYGLPFCMVAPTRMGGAKVRHWLAEWRVGGASFFCSLTTNELTTGAASCKLTNFSSIFILLAKISQSVKVNDFCLSVTKYEFVAKPFKHCLCNKAEKTLK